MSPSEKGDWKHFMSKSADIKYLLDTKIVNALHSSVEEKHDTDA